MQEAEEKFFDRRYFAISSSARFKRYLIWADGDHARALGLYALNTQVSETLHAPLRTQEATLRNRRHAVLSEEVHEHRFGQNGFLAMNRQYRQLEKVRVELRRGGKEPMLELIVAGPSLNRIERLVGQLHDVGHVAYCPGVRQIRSDARDECRAHVNACSGYGFGLAAAVNQVLRGPREGLHVASGAGVDGSPMPRSTSCKTVLEILARPIGYNLLDDRIGDGRNGHVSGLFPSGFCGAREFVFVATFWNIMATGSELIGAATISEKIA